MYSADINKYTSERKDTFDTITPQFATLFPAIIAERYSESNIFNEFLHMLSTLNELHTERINTVIDPELRYLTNLLYELKNSLGIHYESIDATDAKQIAKILANFEFLIRTKTSLLSIFKLLEILDLRVKHIRRQMYNLQSNTIYYIETYLNDKPVSHVLNFANAYRTVKLDTGVTGQYELPSNVTTSTIVLDVISSVNKGYYNDSISGKIFDKLLQYISPVMSDIIVNILYEYNKTTVSFSNIFVEENINGVEHVNITSGITISFPIFHCFRQIDSVFTNSIRNDFTPTTHEFTNVSTYTGTTKTSLGIIMKYSNNFARVAY